MMRFVKKSGILGAAVGVNIIIFLFGVLTNNTDLMLVSVISGILCYIGTKY